MATTTTEVKTETATRTFPIQTEQDLGKAEAAPVATESAPAQTEPIKEEATPAQEKPKIRRVIEEEGPNIDASVISLFSPQAWRAS
jgi:hypothetical protein